MAESRSPLKRMRSLRLKKNRNTLKKNEEAGDDIKNDETTTGNAVKWSRNPDAIGTVLSEVQNELSSAQLSSLGSSLAAGESNSLTPVKTPSPRLRKNTKSSNKSSNTKSTRFFKLPSRAKTPESKTSHFQQIDLREIEICQQIGRGASSAGVFLCLVDGWACAMKQLKREHVGAIDIRCFEREMDILYQLPPHPSIVRYLFHTSMGTDLCLFMQLYSGTLREHLDERRKTNRYLSPDKIAQISLEAAQGIQFLHQHGVIHRDIKAGNVFCTKNEEDEITRIAIGDFDTSLRVSASLRNVKAHANGDMIIRDEEIDSPLLPRPRANNRLNTAEKRTYFAQNRPKSTVGTAGFMAPEVLRSRGSTPYGFKADIYSFGMLLYEMLTLKLPFETLDTVDIIDAVLDGTQVDSMKIDSIIREKYRSLVDLYIHCTTMNPEERPSIDRIIRELIPMLSEGNFVLSVERKPSLVEQLNKFNLTGSRPPRVDIDRDIDLDAEMEADINSVVPPSTVSGSPPSIKFRGPQTQPMDTPPRTRLPPALGINPQRDKIIQEEIGGAGGVSTSEKSEFSEDHQAPDSARSSKLLQRSMSIFKGGIDARKAKKREKREKKEKKEKKDKKEKKGHRTRRPSQSEVSQDDPDTPVIPVKRPKRNTISKSTMLQRSIDRSDPDEIISPYPNNG